MSEPLPPRAWIPNLVTMLNIGVGFGAVVAAAAEEPDLAVYLMTLAVLLDTADGRLARMLGATSRFGMELDSLCDAVAFGVAPAFMAYQTFFRPLGLAGVALAVFYLLCVVYRLARFNLLADEHAKSRRTVGVPSPVGAGYVMAAVLIRDQLPTIGAIALVLFISLAMVSRWPLPDMKGKGLMTGMIVIAIFNFLAVVAWPNWYTIGWWNGWNVITVIAAVIEDRRGAMLLESTEVREA